MVRRYIVGAIIWKEWRELFRNKTIVFTILFISALLSVIIPTVFGIIMALEPSSEELPIGGELGNYVTALEKMLAGLYILFFPLLLIIIPVMASNTLAIYSFVGEKERKTLEPLLLIPATDFELLIGKILSVYIPAIAIGFVSNLIYFLVVKLYIEVAYNVFLLPHPVYLVTVFLLAPVFAFLVIELSVFISIISSDIRKAENLSGTIVLPIVILIVGTLSGAIILTLTEILVITIVLAVISIGLIKVLESEFNREKLITSI